MKLELPKLPYDMNSLAPHISEKTVKFHYLKHHQGYVNKAIEAVKGTPFENASVEEIIQKTQGSKKDKKLFNLVAQIWNHDLYWHSMSPKGGGEPTGALAAQIDLNFGSIKEFEIALKNCALAEFGSGYAWLIYTNEKLQIVSDTDAEIPVKILDQAILNMDVWEHAYYLDYQNDRGNYIDHFLSDLINWENASKRFEKLISQQS